MAKKGKKKIRRDVARGIIHIKATFNNTVITVTDRSGNTLCWETGGTIGYKGSRKSTPFGGRFVNSGFSARTLV